MNVNTNLISSRIISKIHESIATLDLNLNGYNILTEVGSGLYNYMPIIPALAGANKVMAWTSDSLYGKASEIVLNCKNQLDKLNLTNAVEFYVGDLNIEHIRIADLITNSGFLRPLNKSKLKYTKNSVVIPLMYELWELRHNDIDVDYCKERGIKIAGTNESHDSLQVFQHIGHLAVKMAFEAGYEVIGNTIVVWSDDPFGDEVFNIFSKLNPKYIIKTTDYEILEELIHDIDFIFLCDYDEERSYTSNSFFNIKKLISKNNYFGIVHLYGHVDLFDLQDNISVYPRKNGYAKTMSLTLSHLGINPFVTLMAAGYKVGEYLLHGINDDEIMQFCV